MTDRLPVLSKFEREDKESVFGNELDDGLTGNEKEIRDQLGFYHPRDGDPVRVPIVGESDPATAYIKIRLYGAANAVELFRSVQFVPDAADENVLVGDIQKPLLSGTEWKLKAAKIDGSGVDNQVVLEWTHTKLVSRAFLTSRWRW